MSYPLKPLSLILAAAMMLCIPLAADAAVPSVSAGAAELLCLNSGETLFSLNADCRHSMASTTKIMTALLLIEQASPSKTVTVTEQMAAVEGTSMGLLPGDTVTYDALAHGMLLQSGNDAANTAAISIAGSAEKFAVLMNRRALQIGMCSTHFVTPSGLDDDEHYSTAHDMALLAAQALKNPVFAGICSKKSETLCYGDPPYRRTLTNHNKLLWRYEGACGVKTGFTKKSGRCLVSAAKRNGVCLVAVTLNDPDDWNDHTAMLDYGFSVLEPVTPTVEEPILSAAVTGGEQNSVPLRLFTDGVFVNPGEITSTVLIPHFLYAPVTEGEIAGKVVFSEPGGQKVTGTLLAARNVEAKKANPEAIAAKDNEKFISFTKFIKSFFLK